MIPAAGSGGEMHAATKMMLLGLLVLMQPGTPATTWMRRPVLRRVRKDRLARAHLRAVSREGLGFFNGQ